MERGAFAVRDLSPMGARLVGELELFEGERVGLTLELEQPVELLADVVHIDRQRKVVEVAFRSMTEHALALIERSIAQMLERVRTSAPPTVLIVHPTVDVSSALERDLARVGVAARVCTTIEEVDAFLLDNRPDAYEQQVERLL